MTRMLPFKRKWDVACAIFCGALSVQGWAAENHLSTSVATEQATEQATKLVQGKLDNGLEYAILPLYKEANHIEVRLKVAAGSIDETEQQAGVAHMVEHLAFRATQQFPQGIMDYLHANQWQRGKNYNAVTTYDSTTYMFTPPAKSGLNQTLEALSQMTLHAKLTQEDLDKERQIIREEWRGGQGVGNRMNQQRTQSVRVDSRYTRNPVIGTLESINQMPATELQQFYATWYVPNNMQLLIVGDVQVEEAKKLIAQYFGNAASKVLPTRDYYEPKLSDTLRLKQLQDPQSGVSQIAYIVRFDEKANRAQTDEGRMQRLIDRLTLSMLTQRLRNQQQMLLDGVNSLVVRKSDIGKTSVALGIFAGVDSTAQRAGLLQIFTEIARLKKYPFTQQELDEQKKLVQAQIDHAKNFQENDRAFADWMQAMMNTVLMDKPYLTQPEIAALTQTALDKITLLDVQTRLNQWLDEKDRIIQYQAPHKTEIAPLTLEEVTKIQQQASRTMLKAPEKVVQLKAMEFAPLTKMTGKITKEQDFPTQNVVHWQLSNGDRVVWLKSALAKNRTYFLAQSNAGFNSEGLSDWQSQIAQQMIAQNAPLDWQIEQLNDWKKREKVNLSFKQTASKFILEGNSDNPNLDKLFRLYYAVQMETQIKDGVDDTKQDLLKQFEQRQSQEYARNKAIERLRYGKTFDLLPSQAELEQLSTQDLDEQWQIMRGAPVTYFIVNNLNAAQMRPLIENYLAIIPRGKNLENQPLFPVAGIAQAEFALNLAPRNDVQLWSFSPQSWQGKDAMLVFLLQNIVSNKLKLNLRDKHLGIYSLRFESTLNPETQRVESTLSFTADPAKTAMLIEEAKQTLEKLPDMISQEDIQQAESSFKQQEKVRLERVETWLHRLVLSENQYQDPRYLSDMQHLGENIQLDSVKRMASKIYNRDNVKVFITTPVLSK